MSVDRRRTQRVRRRRRALFLALLLAACTLVFTVISVVDPRLDVPVVPDPIEEFPADATLQEMIDLAEPGQMIVVPPGIYRETVLIDKPIHLEAEVGAEIRGSDIWDSWSRYLNQWTSERTLPEFRNDHVSCQKDELCQSQEQVFFDGDLLEQVSASPGPGQFAVDEGRRIILGQNPRRAMVEVSTRKHWVVGASDDVIIDGFIMQHAANFAQTGALTTGGYSGWVVQNNVFALAHGTAVALSQGRDLTLTRNNIHSNGQLGVQSWDASEVHIVDNLIHGNNTQGFHRQWEAGGIKITEGESIRIEDNHIFGNAGPGIWCDADCARVWITGNRVASNQSPGIIYEISRQGEIAGNVVWGNGYSIAEGPRRAGIFVQNSSTTEVRANVVAWNGAGIVIWSEPRGVFRWDNVTGNYVHDNDVFIAPTREWDDFGLAWIEFQHDGRMGLPESNNRGANNRYYHADPERASGNTFIYLNQWFGWDELEAFNETPGDDGGRHMTENEMAWTLSRANVPLEPSINHSTE